MGNVVLSVYLAPTHEFSPKLDTFHYFKLCKEQKSKALLACQQICVYVPFQPSEKLTEGPCGWVVVEDEALCEWRSGTVGEISLWPV